jgi:hypothetical protein
MLLDRFAVHLAVFRLVHGVAERGGNRLFDRGVDLELGLALPEEFLPPRSVVFSSCASKLFTFLWRKGV